VNKRTFSVRNLALDDPERVVAVDEGAAKRARTVRAASSRPQVVSGPLRYRR
jgi:hypothetical protein